MPKKTHKRLKQPLLEFFSRKNLHSLDCILSEQYHRELFSNHIWAQGRLRQEEPCPVPVFPLFCYEDDSDRRQLDRVACTARATLHHLRIAPDHPGFGSTFFRRASNASAQHFFGCTLGQAMLLIVFAFQYCAYLFQLSGTSFQRIFCRTSVWRRRRI